MEYVLAIMYFVLAMSPLAVGFMSYPRIINHKLRKAPPADWYLGECIPPETKTQRLNRERYEQAREFMSSIQ